MNLHFLAFYGITTFTLIKYANNKISVNYNYNKECLNFSCG